MPRIALKTFGCKVNLCDSRDLAARLEALGAEVVPGRDASADAYVVNSCAVTDRAVRKCAQCVRSIRRERPGAPVAVYGCGPSYGKGIPDAPGSASFARGDEEALVAFLAEKLGLHGGGAREVEGPSTSGFRPHGDDGFPQDPDLGRTRAFVKVGDGCDGACTYCVVPRLRGAPRSRLSWEIAAEAARFASGGCREIVLTAIHLGIWGRDLEPPESLASLVRLVAGRPGVARVRLSSVEAAEVDEPLLALADLPAFAPHFHLPLQSGDDGVLRRMGRRTDAAGFLERVARVRGRFPSAGLTTDVIVGFPGESDEAFRNTLRVAREAGFTRIHAFPFSPREGTPAASLPGRVPREAVKERMDALIALGLELARAFRRSREGALDRVLVEREVPGRPGFVEGWDGTYQRVVLPGGAADLGGLVEVRIAGSERDACRGERV